MITRLSTQGGRRYRQFGSTLSLVASLASVSAGEIAIAAPITGQARQINASNQANIPISGTWSGFSGGIEASFNGGAYVTIVASPTGGTFSGTLSNQSGPARGTLTVRSVTRPSVAATVAILLGDCFVGIGDSRLRCSGTSNQAYTGSQPGSMYRIGAGWSSLADPTGRLAFGTPNGSWWIEFANQYEADRGVPCAVLNMGYDGTTLTDDWQRGIGLYADMVSEMATAALGNTPKGFLCMLGAVDSWETPPADATEWKGLVEQLRADLHTDFPGAILFMDQLGEQTGASPTRASLDAIREGTRRAVNASGGSICLLFVLHDVDTDDGTHYTTSGKLTTLGRRAYHSVAEKHYGGAARSGRGPQVTDAVIRFDGLKVNVTFAMATTPITPASSIAGFRVLEDGTPVTIASVVRIGDNDVEITLSAPLTGTPTLDLSSGNDGAGAAVPKDSSSDALPAEAFSGLAVAIGDPPTVLRRRYPPFGRTLSLVATLPQGGETSGSIQPSDGTASASGVVAGVGASIAAAAGTTAGAGALAGAGVSTAASVGAATGVGAVSGVSGSTAAGAGTVTGTGALAGVGASTAASAGTLTGTGTLSGSSQEGVSAGSCEAAGTLSGVGASIVASVGTLAGTGALVGVGLQLNTAAGTLAGTSTLAGVGASIASAAGTLTGTGTLTGGSVQGLEPFTIDLAAPTTPTIDLARPTSLIVDLEKP